MKIDLCRTSSQISNLWEYFSKKKPSVIIWECSILYWLMSDCWLLPWITQGYFWVIRWRRYWLNSLTSEFPTWKFIIFLFTFKSFINKHKLSKSSPVWWSFFEEYCTVSELNNIATNGSISALDFDNVKTNWLFKLSIFWSIRIFSLNSLHFCQKNRLLRSKIYCKAIIYCQ